MRTNDLVVLSSLPAILACACVQHTDGGSGTLQRGKADNSEVDLDVRPVLVEPLASCWVVKDTSSSDPFFLVDEVQCQVVPPPAPLVVDFAVAEVRNQDLSLVQSQHIEPANYGKVVTAARVHRSKWPATINVTVGLRVERSPEGTPSGAEMATWIAAEKTGSPDNLSQGSPVAVESPVALWKLVLVPAREMWDSFSSASLSAAYDVPVPTTRLCVAGPTVGGSAKVKLGRTVRELSQVSETIWLPVPAQQPSFLLDLHLRLWLEEGGKSEGTQAVPAPGYYTLLPDGTLRPSLKEDLGGLGLNGGADGDVEPGTAGAGAGVTPEGSCGGVACTASQACVGSVCVARSQQTTGSACDASENDDCADGHVCVAGKCKNRGDQTVWNSASCDNDDNTDCADGHVCVSGKCRAP